MFNDFLDWLQGQNPNAAMGEGGDPRTQAPPPNAVSQMAQTPQGLMGPGPATMPDMGSPSLMTQMHYAPLQTLAHGLSAFGRGAQNAVAPMPPGMEGLFSPDQVGQARNRGLLDFGLSMLGNSRSQHYGEPAPSLGSALQQGVEAGRGGVQNQLTGSLQNQMMALQLAQQLRVLRARQSMGPAMMPQPGESQGDWLDRARDAWRTAIGNSDFQTADALKDVIKTPELDPSLFAMAHPDELQQFDLGDKIVLRSRRSGQSITLPKTAAPISPLDIKKFNQTQLQDFNSRQSDLVGKYQSETKDIREAANNLRNISGVRQRALTGDPAAQIALIDSYLRTINPGGMARPAQIAMAADARSWKDRIQNFMQNPKTGQKMSATQVQRFVNAANDVGNSWRQKYGPIESRYKQWAHEAQVDPGVVLDDPFTGVSLGGADSTGAPAPAGPPSSASIRRRVPPSLRTPPAQLPPMPPPVPNVQRPAAPPAAGAQTPSPISLIQSLLFGPKRFPDNMGMPQ